MSKIYKSRLKDSGFKLTQPRLKVLEYMKKKGKPVTAKSTFAFFKSNLDLVTIYRVFKTLQEAGIAQVETIKGEQHFYLAEHHHHHVTCEKCQQIECVPCDFKLPKIKNFNNIAHTMSLTGICNNCI